MQDSRAGWGCESSMVLPRVGVKHPSPPSYEGSPSPVQGTWAWGQAPLTLQGCTAPTARGISPSTQARISSTFPEMLGRATAGMGAAGGWQDPTGHKVPCADVGSPRGPSPARLSGAGGSWWRWEAMGICQWEQSSMDQDPWARPAGP